MKERTEMICELIKPKECFILWKDSDGIVYVGNKDGNAFVVRALYPK